MVEAADNKKPAWEILQMVMDPEIPVLSVVDLGIVRDIRSDGDRLNVVITPTYSGCPAMDMIAGEISTMLRLHGYEKPEITTQLSPVWTTDWMSAEGRRKLKQYGIAPPAVSTAIECPLCHSITTEKISEFGSTSCKALYRCLDCKEPFDYFKCI